MDKIELDNKLWSIYPKEITATELETYIFFLIEKNYDGKKKKNSQGPTKTQKIINQ